MKIIGVLSCLFAIGEALNRRKVDIEEVVKYAPFITGIQFCSSYYTCRECTGTLISPTKILSSGDCTCMTDSTRARQYYVSTCFIVLYLLRASDSKNYLQYFIQQVKENALKILRNLLRYWDSQNVKKYVNMNCTTAHVKCILHIYMHVKNVMWRPVSD